MEDEEVQQQAQAHSQPYDQARPNAPRNGAPAPPKNPAASDLNPPTSGNKRARISVAVAQVPELIERQIQTPRQPSPQERPNTPRNDPPAPPQDPSTSGVNPPTSGAPRAEGDVFAAGLPVPVPAGNRRIVRIPATVMQVPELEVEEGHKLTLISTWVYEREG